MNKTISKKDVLIIIDSWHEYFREVLKVYEYYNCYNCSYEAVKEKMKLLTEIADEIKKL